MEFCIETLGHNKYTKEQVREKEMQIVQICQWDLCQVTQLDIMMVFISSLGIIEH